MKQHIDSEQLKELNFEQVNKLGKMSKLLGHPRTAEEWEKNKQKEYLTMYDYLLKWINIGNMIEILSQTHYFNISLYKIEVWEHGDIRTFKAYKGELCDALWQAIKDVLEGLE